MYYIASTNHCRMDHIDSIEKKSRILFEEQYPKIHKKLFIVLRIRKPMLAMKDFDPSESKIEWKLQINFNSAVRAKLGIIVETSFTLDGAVKCTA